MAILWLLYTIRILHTKYCIGIILGKGIHFKKEVLKNIHISNPLHIAVALFPYFLIRILL